MAEGQSRPRKSPEEKARVALEGAQNKYGQAQTRVDRLKQQLDEATAKRDQARRDLDYAKSNPSLPNAQGASTDGDPREIGEGDEPDSDLPDAG